MSRRVALVCHASDGGVWSVTRFLRNALQSDNRYESDVILLATSMRDPASVRLLAPRTWFEGPQVLAGHLEGNSCYHVGATLVEFEFQRYQPRRVLTDLLNRYDLVQVAVGTPAWLYVTRDVRPPVCLFVATLAQKERTSALRQSRGWRKQWSAMMTRFTTQIERQALPLADCVFAESEYTLRLLARDVMPERLLLGVPGVDTEFFSPGSSYLPEGHILAVGRLQDPRKNVRMLFDAYYRLRQAVLYAPRLVLAGKTNPRLEDWTYAAELNLTDHIDLYVNVSPEKLLTLYRKAALFVVSSDEEGLGVVILEAMACGLPVVSTGCGGPATAVVEGQTGLLTPVGDAQALANAMQHLLASPELRRQMGQAGRQVVERRFSLAAAGKVYLDKYDGLVNIKSS